MRAHSSPERRSANAASSWLWSARSLSGAPADADAVTVDLLPRSAPELGRRSCRPSSGGGSGGSGAFALSELVGCAGADPKDLGSDGFAGRGGVVGGGAQQR